MINGSNLEQNLDAMFNRLKQICFAAALLGWATQASHSENLSKIDQQLYNQLDFRGNQFKICFGKTTCKVSGLIIRGFNRSSYDSDWFSAQIYWDPIDGLGILGGGQNDEIDINERLIVSFPTQRDILGIWFSDLFINEDSRYDPLTTGSSTNDSDTIVTSEIANNYETAGIELRLKNKVSRQLLIRGNLNLPNISFNESIAPKVFDSGYDLKQRLIVKNDIAYLLSTESEGEKSIILKSIPIGKLRRNEQKILKNLTINGNSEDLLEQFTEKLDSELYSEGDRNSKNMQSILHDSKHINEIRNAANIGRVVGSVPNGEVAGILDGPINATSIMFYSPTSSSNDFSIAGIIFRTGWKY